MGGERVVGESVLNCVVHSLCVEGECGGKCVKLCTAHVSVCVEGE